MSRQWLDFSEKPYGRREFAERFIGSKAYALYSLAAAGIPVPKGLSLTTQATAGLAKRRLVGGSSFYQLAEDAIEQAGLVWPLAVRSSAVGEDGRVHSFAGLLETVLNVKTQAELHQALHGCLQAYRSDRVLAYEKAVGARLGGCSILIQELVPATVAGVCFTKPPAAVLLGQKPSTEALPDNLIYLEFCAGLGDKLVSGYLTPAYVLVDRKTSQLIDFKVPADMPESDVCHRFIALEGYRSIIEQALAIEEICGSVQDIEWCCTQKGEHYEVTIIQARPITEPLFNYSRANIAENYPRPVTPFLHSLAVQSYEHYFRNLGRAIGVGPKRIQSIDRDLKQTIGCVDGRLYYNLSAIHACLSVLPRGINLSQSFNTFVGEARAATALSKKRKVWLRKVKEGAELLWIGLKTLSIVVSLSPRLRAFERRSQACLSKQHQSTRDALKAFLDIRFDHWTGAGLCDAYAMIMFSLAKKMAQKGEGGQEALTAQLAFLGASSGGALSELQTLAARVQAQPHLKSELRASPPEVLARQYADFRKGLPCATEKRDFFLALKAYLERWGYRSPLELMLTEPNYIEDPTPFLGLFCTLLEGPETRSTAGNPAGIAAQKLKKRSFYEGIVHTELRRALKYRERARLQQSRLYAFCRGSLLAAGRELKDREVLAQAQDIFLLEVKEVLALLAGTEIASEGLRDLLDERRALHEKHLAKATPPEWLSSPIALNRWDAEAPWVPGAGEKVDAAAAEASLSVLTGMSACPGQVQGPARVVRSASESSRLKFGDILVTEHTDPGWTPLFALVKGLVIEKGGLLSHAAIIAREFGIPAVIGVKNACSLVADGEVIRLDGGAGKVSISKGQSA